MKKIALIAVAAAALVAGTVHAKPGGARPNPDANGDGVVTKAEIDADVGKRFAHMDVNKDGKLDKSDREAAMKEREARRGEREGRMMAMIDTNKDGAISLDEMKRAAMMRFERADANKDGKLTKAEREAARPRGGEPDGPPPPLG